MSQIRQRLVNFTLISFLLGSVFHASPALGAILTKQEFTGDFTLVDSSPLLENTLPEKSEYSGFVVYEEDGTLRDWEVNVNELNLNLNPDPISPDPTLPDAPFPNESTPNVNFELSSLSNWNLIIDFGIAFDAPRYTLERTSGSEINFIGEVGLAGGYSYTDSTAKIIQSSSKTSVPEPSTILATILASGAGASLLKRKRRP